jgi:hypothetical protein
MKRKPVLIALAGSNAVAMDVVAQHLVSKHGFASTSWNTPLEELCLATNPVIWLPGSWGWGKHRTLAKIIDEMGWGEAMNIPQVEDFVFSLQCGVENNLGSTAFTDATVEHIKRTLRSGKSVVVQDTETLIEAKRVLELNGNIVLVDSSGGEYVPASAHAIAVVEDCDTEEVLKEKTSIVFKTLDAEVNQDDDVEVHAELYIARMEQTVQRSKAMAINTIVGVAAPENVGIDEYIKRHRVAVSEMPDGVIAVQVDGELAGEVLYEDGLLTVDILIAR